MPSTTQSRSGEYRKLWSLGKRPSLSQLVELGQGLSPSKLSELVLLDQSLRWDADECVAAEQYFALFPELSQHRESAIDLVYSEFLLRERLGYTHDIEEFLRRFPDFAEDLKCQNAFHRMIDTGLEHADDSSLRAESLDTKEDPVTNGQLPNLPGYQILGELGRGGSGVVYKARHLQLNRFVALKMLLAGHFASPNLLRRFLVEAEATARLQHPNIVQIYEVGQIDGRPFLALEFVNGGTLSQSVNGRPLPLREAVSIVKQLARAVHFAHEQGVVHRDLKPGNVLIQKLSSSQGADVEHDSQLKIADFGLAKLIEQPIEHNGDAATMSGDVLGTATYMSPEQARGDVQALTLATDVYSLGAILYELLTGRPPFVGVQPIEIMGQVLHDEPMRPSQLVQRLPRDVQTICLKCLEKNPERRYASAEALADDLTRFMENQPIVARQISALERGWRWCRRHPATTSLAASIAGFLILVSIVSSLYTIQLGNQLRRISFAESQERRSKIDAWNQLWESKLAQADAIRMSKQSGQRFEALRAIEEAQSMGDFIRFTSEQIDQMRDATSACLALPDMRVDGSWTGCILPQVIVHDSDPSHSWITYEHSNHVFVCRSSTGVEVARIPTQSAAKRVRLSDDGRKLALVNNECRVYSLDGDEPRLIFECQAQGVWDFTPDSSKILGTNGTGELILVDLNRNNEITRYGTFLAVSEIQVSPNLQFAALYNGKNVRVIELSTGRFHLEIDRSTLSGNRHFAWHPNSQVLAIASTWPGGIELWNLNDQTVSATIPYYFGETSLVFSATGERLLVYDNWGSKLLIWNVNKSQAEFSKSGLYVLCPTADVHGGFRMLNWEKDSRLTLVRVDVPTVYHTLPYPSSKVEFSVLDLAYSQDGRLLAVANGHGDVMIFNALNHSLLGYWYCGSNYVQFDGNSTLLTSNSLGLAKWEIRPNDNMPGDFTIGPPEYVSKAVAYAPFAVSRDRKVAISTHTGIEIRSLSDSRPVQAIAPTNDVRRLSFSPDGNRLATGEWSNGEFCIWDLESGKRLRQLPESLHCMVEYSQNGKWIATNSNQVRIRDADTGELITEIPTYGTSTSGACMAFSPDSKTIVVSDSNGKINFFDPSTGQKFYSLTNPSDEQTIRLAFNPNGQQLAVLSDAYRVHLWSLDSMQRELQSRRLELAQFPVIPEDNNSRNENPLENESNTESISRITSLTIQLDQRFLELDATRHVKLLREHVKKMDLYSAKLAIAKIIQLQPQSSFACNALAWTLATGPKAIRNAAMSVEFARRALSDPNLRANRRAMYLNTLGVALYRDGQFSEAYEVLTQSLAGHDEVNRPFDLYFLAMCCSQLREYEKSHEHFAQAESLTSRLRAQMSSNDILEIDEFADEAKLLLKFGHEGPAFNVP